MAEFVGEKAVFYQNGTWAWNDVSSLGAENLTMLPIYIGVEGEENQGLCTGTENYWCANPFVQIDAQYTAEGKLPVSWNFATIPSEEWKNGVGSALTAYAAGTGDWDAVKTAFVDGWATEYKLSH